MTPKTGGGKPALCASNASLPITEMPANVKDLVLSPKGVPDGLYVLLKLIKQH